MTQANLAQWREKHLTAKQLANLVERMERKARMETIAESISPIVEFFYIAAVASRRDAKWELFSTNDGSESDHPYLAGLKTRLESSHGVYVFHDSRGKAIYVGKARLQSLWKEMNEAFNRNRGEVQNIKRVDHPSNRVVYRGPDEQKRRIIKQSVPLYDIAAYISAYKVHDELIGKMEALIIRTFANDLLNVRMENF